MRRFVGLMLMALLLVGPMPARASEGSQSGSVILPILHPTVPRALHNQGIDTNLIAVIFQLPASADNKPYVLSRTSGFGNLDAYFYTAGPGNTLGDICSPVAGSDDDVLNPTTESGTICPGASVAKWAVVLLAWGANAGFTFTW